MPIIEMLNSHNKTIYLSLNFENTTIGNSIGREFMIPIEIKKASVA